MATPYTLPPLPKKVNKRHHFQFYYSRMQINPKRKESRVSKTHKNGIMISAKIYMKKNYDNIHRKSTISNQKGNKSLVEVSTTALSSPACDYSALSYIRLQVLSNSSYINIKASRMIYAILGFRDKTHQSHR